MENHFRVQFAKIFEYYKGQMDVGDLRKLTGIAESTLVSYLSKGASEKINPSYENIQKLSMALKIDSGFFFCTKSVEEFLETESDREINHRLKQLPEVLRIFHAQMIIMHTTYVVQETAQVKTRNESLADAHLKVMAKLTENSKVLYLPGVAKQEPSKRE